MPADAPTPKLRIAAYCVCVDDADRVLLARWVGRDRPQWSLPGGGLDFGEHPQVGAVRELTEETGYVGEIDALLGVDREEFEDRDGNASIALRIVYRARIVGGDLVFETGGSTDQAAWVPLTEVAGLDAVPLVGVGIAMARGAGRPVVAQVSSPVPGSELPRATRTTAYALIRDAAGAVLLVRGSPGTTWAGHWLLPGGGIEWGESVPAAIRRESIEETGLEVEVGPVVMVTSDVVDSASRGRQLFTVRVVCEAEVVGGALRAEVAGSSDRVAWVGPAEIAELPVMPFVREVLALPS